MGPCQPLFLSPRSSHQNNRRSGTSHGVTEVMGSVRQDDERTLQCGDPGEWFEAGGPQARRC